VDFRPAVVNEVRSIWNIGELRLISKRIERVRLAEITPMSFRRDIPPSRHRKTNRT
jgi:hypothetical protein